MIGFDCREHSVRRSDYEGYKAHRPPKPAELEEQLDAAPALMSAAGLAVVVPAGYEADDVLASSAALAATSGWRCVAVTSDRDAFALLDESTSVLRIHSGDTDRFSLPDGGDAAGDLRRCRRRPTASWRRYAVTPRTISPAFRGWERRPPPDSWQPSGPRARLRGHGKRFHGLVSEAVGDRLAAQLATAEARLNVARNRGLMAMRRDVPLPELSSMRLPVDLTRMQAVFGTSGDQSGTIALGAHRRRPAGPGRFVVGVGKAADGRAAAQSELLPDPRAGTARLLLTASGGRILAAMV